MITARIFSKKAYLAIILLVAALMFPGNSRAASGNVQNCQPNTTCEIGEFLYDDSYDPILDADADCFITSTYPNGVDLLFDSVSIAGAADGWYSKQFTAPTTVGLYRTEIRCTTGGETLALDKSFEVKTAESTLSSSDVTGAVWNASRSSYTGSGTFGESLQTIVPSASSVASATWGYTDRTLSTFGTLVSSIWSNTARTLTGEAADSDLKALKKQTSETRLLIEKVVNKPIIQNVLEQGLTVSLQSKIKQTEETADKLYENIQYLKGKSSLVQARWKTYSGREVVSTINELSSVSGDMFKLTDYFKENWSFSVSSSIYAQDIKVKSTLTALNKEVEARGKSSKALGQFKELSARIVILEQLVGRSSETNSSKTLFGSISQVKNYIAELDLKSKDLTAVLTNWDQYNSKNEGYKGINSLSKGVASLNRLPKINTVLLSNLTKNTTDRELKNKTLTLQGIVKANKVYIAQKPGQSFSNTWLEEGSIVFKTLITNPSSLVSQDVPVKYYLPAEVKEEKIIKIDDGLTIEYDAEKGQYFVAGNFTLKPSETKTFSVEVDDGVFIISQEALDSIRNQADQLSKPLNNTAYFAQGVTLKSDINASLDRIDVLQKNIVTPEDRIRSYREASIELKSADSKLDNLKELATSAGSVGTLFGFVGGAQVLAVWGLIIIMVAGFVFLSLYMRTIRPKEAALTVKERQPLPITEDEFVRDDVLEEKIPTPSHRRFYFGKSFKYIAVLIVATLIGGGSLYALRPGQVSKQKTEISQEIPQTKTQSVLGTDSEQSSPSAKINKDSYIDINIFVPDGSEVAIHSDPSLTSPVLTSLRALTKAKEIKRQDSWVKITFQDIEGWIDGDFIEAKKINDASPLKAVDKIVIKETPTGFLRVRVGPWGQEITKVFPDETYPFIEEDGQWYKIELDDSSIGWVYKSYAKIMSENTNLSYLP